MSHDTSWPCTGLQPYIKSSSHTGSTNFGFWWACRSFRLSKPVSFGSHVIYSPFCGRMWDMLSTIHRSNCWWLLFYGSRFYLWLANWQYCHFIRYLSFLGCWIHKVAWFSEGERNPLASWLIGMNCRINKCSSCNVITTKPILNAI